MRVPTSENEFLSIIYYNYGRYFFHGKFLFGRKTTSWKTFNIARVYRNACPVESLTDVFGLVERFRDVSGEHGVHGAHDDQHDRVTERYHVRRVDERRADQYVRLPARIIVDGFGRTDQHPHSVDEHLKRNNMSSEKPRNRVIDKRGKKNTAAKRFIRKTPTRPTAYCYYCSGSDVLL